jgi:hypothetical protein
METHRKAGEFSWKGEEFAVVFYVGGWGRKQNPRSCPFTNLLSLKY